MRRSASTCSGKLGPVPDWLLAVSQGLWPRGGGWEPGPALLDGSPGCPSRTIGTHRCCLGHAASYHTCSLLYQTRKEIQNIR